MFLIRLANSGSREGSCSRADGGAPDVAPGNSSEDGPSGRPGSRALCRSFATRKAKGHECQSGGRKNVKSFHLTRGIGIDKIRACEAKIASEVNNVVARSKRKSQARMWLAGFVRNIVTLSCRPSRDDII